MQVSDKGVSDPRVCDTNHENTQLPSSLFYDDLQTTVRAQRTQAEAHRDLCISWDHGNKYQFWGKISETKNVQRNSFLFKSLVKY